jgi:hypothetical protein
LSGKEEKRKINKKGLSVIDVTYIVRLLLCFSFGKEERKNFLFVFVLRYLYFRKNKHCAMFAHYVGENSYEASLPNEIESWKGGEEARCLICINNHIKHALSL